jgi:hypothetical protein
MDINAIRVQAESEFKAEIFRREVEKYKQKLREKKTLWDQIFPWKIIVIRKDKQ